MQANCAGCGCDLALEIPDGNGGAARWLRNIAAHSVRCEECAAKQEAHEVERERRQAREQRRDRCQLPNRLRGRLLQHFKPRVGQAKAMEAVTDWASSEKPGSLVLTGAVGVGKTELAAAACWTRLERWPCRYASVARSMSKLGRSFTDEGRVEVVQFFSGCGDAVLDDLDKCRVTEFGAEQLFAAVDGRQQEDSALLVTTNLTPDEIGERYGDAIMSRLAAPHCRVVEVGGEDHRVAG
jgi:DNA replication protein DnaC